MRILAINAFYHDSAAAFLQDGKVVSAIEEERFSRVKHDNNFPYQAIKFCLEANNLTINNIDFVAYYEKPLLKFERILETFLETWPGSLNPFLQAIPDWLGQKIKIEQIIRKKLGFGGKVYFIPHHYSHAAAAFFTSAYKTAAILTVDGVGEYQTTGLWLGKDSQITPLKAINFPHSLGLLYSTFTAFLGFKVNEDEYKLMGLSAYGKPDYEPLIQRLIKVKPDGSFNLNLNYFSYREKFQMWSREFAKLFGPARKPNEPILTRHKNLAASIQKITAEIYLRMLNYLATLTDTKNLVVSGGVALNALANGQIYSQTPFQNVHVLGAAGDSGAAIGAGLYLYQSILRKGKINPVTSLSLGSGYSDRYLEDLWGNFSLKYRKFDQEKELLRVAAKYLRNGKIIGWFQGKCEFGPRALGNRSILARPFPRIMKAKVNLIKRREQFRPFAASVLQEKVRNYFAVPRKNHASPFMNFCFQVRKDKRREIAAITHADNSCRVQTVSRVNGRYWRLLKEYYRQTKSAVILNTSFNLKGEPIVESPTQAIEDFLKTKMDYLVIENFLVSKS